MALTKAQKQKVLDDLRDKIAKQKAIVFIDFTGLTVKDLFNLRERLKVAGDELKVAKKTLMGIVFKEAKLEIEPKKLPGEVALVFGFKDEISPAKIVYRFSQENEKLKILGGFLAPHLFSSKGGWVEAEKIVELAKLPTKEELLARLVGSISAPVSNFVNVLQAPLEACLSIIRSLGSKLGVNKI